MPGRAARGLCCRQGTGRRACFARRCIWCACLAVPIWPAADRGSRPLSRHCETRPRRAPLRRRRYSAKRHVAWPATLALLRVRRSLRSSSAAPAASVAFGVIKLRFCLFHLPPALAAADAAPRALRGIEGMSGVCCGLRCVVYSHFLIEMHPVAM
jgi:hypothetical protein